MKPVEHPVTMLAVRARAMPCMERWVRLLDWRVNLISEALASKSTPSGTTKLRVPSGPLTEIVLAWVGHGHALGDCDGCVSNSRHVRVPLYQTLQTSSPPTPALRAARSVIMPCEVLMIMTPRPLRTLGMSVQRA